MFFSISNPALFKVPTDDASCFGCDQGWFASEWQRLSGCGPTAATNIIFYLTHNDPSSISGSCFSDKGSCLSLMEEIWAFVTPTTEGIDTTQMFYTSVMAYFQSKNINVAFEVIDLPEDKTLRPKFTELLDFLERAMNNDAPVAFLNLCNGEEVNLEAWHWVTIISLENAEDEEITFVKILDQGQISMINLTLWYNTTELGGGFVYFKKVSA